MVEKKIENLILTSQKSELTEHFVYQKLSQSAMDPHNKSVLKQISDDEMKHYDFWKKYTRQDAKPNKLSIWNYYPISKIFGITFGIKLMEKGVKGSVREFRNHLFIGVIHKKVDHSRCGMQIAECGIKKGNDDGKILKDSGIRRADFILLGQSR